MNLTLNSQLLAAELRALNKIVPAKPALAILSHMRLRADDDVRFYATDLEVGLSTRCLGRVDEPGEVALPVARLLQMVEQFPDGDVALAADGAQAVVRCGAFTGRLQTLPAEDLPDQPEVAGPALSLDAAALRGLIAKTRYAVSTAGTKYVLKGALLTCVGPTAAMVATDGKRLALATVGRTGEDAQIVVPFKTLDVLAGQADEGAVLVTVGDRHLFFAVGDRLLTSRKIEGAFPDYQRVIPRDNANVATIDRGALTAALKRVSLVADDNGAVFFDLRQNVLGLSARSAGIGSADESVAAAYEGPPSKVCLGGAYVLDFLAAAANDVVSLALKDAKSAVLLRDGSDNVGVIMVIR